MPAEHVAGLVTLLAAWTAANMNHICRHKRLIADHRGILDRHVIGRIVRRVGLAAGIPGVHPRRLRHAQTTQANAGMARLRREAHARMLGNGLCTRPAELECRLESAWETCAYFRAGTQSLPVLTLQPDHARDHGQPDRAALFDNLIPRVEGQTS